MNYREMIEAVEDAQLIIGRGDIAVRKLAELVVGRLRRSEVSHHVLRDLKRELRGYNTRQAKWEAEQ